MRPIKKLNSAPFLFAAALLASPLAACSRPYEYNDVVYNDRHRWDSREEEAYRRWEAERRLEHLEFARRNDADQRAYWTWRHAHP